ncbi:DUF6283 family protein [Streptomyces sp. NBC_01092]|uniref:DUF6283 family protein n=1 Tax=Streptomyces sp. NBC_01092 TaxID=2903748 RepID=UPI00386935A3
MRSTRNSADTTLPPLNSPQVCSTATRPTQTAPRAGSARGWAGCHGKHLLSLRVALFKGWIGGAAFEAAAEYQSPVALFDSGSEAADHGQCQRSRRIEHVAVPQN